MNFLEELLRSVFRKYKRKIDLSISNKDGSYTFTRKGGEAVGYQDRKKTNTTNSMISIDRKGQSLYCSEAISGNHHNVKFLEKTVSKILNFLMSCGILTKGLFLNADAGFDINSLRKVCEKEDIVVNVDRNKRNNSKFEDDAYFFEEELYSNRLVIKQSNSWMDAFRGIVLRYVASSNDWHRFQLLAFATFFLRAMGILTFSFKID